MSKRRVLWAAMFLAWPALVVACEDEDPVKRREREEWDGPCRDETWLLATTAGSPSSMKCTNNKLHRMSVEVATHPSNEEAAAVVFCKCEREQDAGP